MPDDSKDMCTGATFTFTPSFTPAVASFTWTRPTTIGIDEAGTTDASNISEKLTNSTPNPITVVYTVKGTTAEGCVGPDAKVSLRVDPLPVAPSGWDLFPDPLCQGAKGQKYSTKDGAGLEWTVSPASSAKFVSGNIGTIIEIDFDDDATVPVTIEVKANNNCGSSGGLTRPVTINPLPNKPDLIVGDPDVCPGTTGEKYSVTPVLGATYVWSFKGTATGKTIIAGTSTDNISVDYDKADLSTATLQVATVATNGCGTSLPIEQELSILDIPTATTSGGAATCITNPLPNVDFFFTGTQPFSFSYTNGVTTITGLTDNPNFTALSGTVAGNYQVLTIEDGNKCQGLPSNITTVSVIPLPDKTLSVTSKDVCLGSPTTITVANTELSASYDAIIKGLKVQTLQGTGGDIVFTIPANRLNAGSDNKIYVIANGNGVQTCESNRLTMSPTVNVVGKLENQSQSPVCDVDLNNQTVVLQPSIGADSYTWSYPVGVTEISSPSNISKVLKFSPTAVATAPIIVTVTPKRGTLSCPQLSGDLSFTFKESYRNTATLTPKEDVLCALDKLTFEIQNTDTKSGVTFNKWTIPVGANVIEYLYEPNPDPRIKNVTGAVIEFGQYSGDVTVEPYANCQVSPIQNLVSTIEIIPTPIANAGNDTSVYTIQAPINLDGTGSKVKNTTGIGPDSIFLSSSNQNFADGTPKYTYLWETSDKEPIPFSTKLTTSAIPIEWEVTYTLNVKSTNKKSCSAKDEKKVIVDVFIKVPNIFSPNGDGLHDEFVIENIQFFKDGLVEIYNQWGDLIYKTRDYKNHQWDGKRNGADMPLATYYYLIYPNVNKYKPISGSISLVR